MSKISTKKTLGSPEKALLRAKEGYQIIPAYKSFLESQGITLINSFEDLPITNKENYIHKYPVKDLISKNVQRGYRITISSGSSSGKPTYWLQDTASIKGQALSLRMFLESNFAIHRQPTLAIIGLQFNGWAASETFDSALKMMSIDTPYIFYTFSPGVDVEGIIQVIHLFHTDIEQVVIFMVPSLIFYLQQRAKDLGYDLPLHKLRYVITGEYIPENLRINWQNQSLVSQNQPFLYSFYGSGDTGILGTESLASICLRKLLYINPHLAQKLGFNQLIPHFFHLSVADTLIEVVDEGILITSSAETPLFRYLLNDKISLYRWQDLKQEVVSFVSSNDGDLELMEIIKKSSDYLPDILALTGRSDSSLILCGANIPEYVLDTVVKNEKLQHILTGIYYAEVIYSENGVQTLKFDLETWQNVKYDEQLRATIYSSFISDLCSLNDLFEYDFKNLYSLVNHKILELNFKPYPRLSENLLKSTKHQSIIKS